MKRLLSLGLLLAAVLLAQPVVSVAAWVASAAGSGSTAATSVSQLGAPTVTRSGSNAVVSWPQGVLGNGVAARGYIVNRTVGATTTTICTTSEPTRTCTDTAPNPGAATYVVQATYRNWVGPVSNPTSFTFDTDAPVTTLTSSPAVNANGYVTSAPTLTLSATDATSSVASISYQIGSASPVTVSGATTSFLVPGTANSTVTYFATDAGGNVEATNSYLVKRDNNAPVTTLTSNPAPSPNGYVSGTPTITLTATDAETSVASITYKVGAASSVTVNAATVSFTVANPGSTSITYSAQDAAGNNESTNTYTVRRDGAAPTTTVTANPAPNAFGYFASAPTLTLTATDAETSVASISYKIGNGALTTVNQASVSFTVPGPATTTVTYYATDAAGNVEATQTYAVGRDASAPSAVTITDPVQNGSYAVGNNGSGSWAKTCGGRGGICATATDAESPVASMTYRLIKNGNTCWNGTAFVAGTGCSVAMTFDSANNDWIGGPTRQQMGVSANWSLTVTATNQAGLTTTSSAVTFRTT